MPLSKDSSNNTENSGLHDLQAMASSAKRRRSQRLSTQMEAQDSLLRSTAALDAVVLPDPNKEQDVALESVAVAGASVAPEKKEATPAAKTEAAEVVSAAAVPVADADLSSGSSKAMYIGLAVVAAGAAAAFFMLGGDKDGKDSGADSSAKPVAAVVPGAEEPEPAMAAPEETKPSLAEAVPSEEAGTDEASGTDEAGTDEAVKPAAAEAEPATPEKVAAKSEKESSQKNPEKVAKAKTETKAARKSDEKPEPKAKPAKEAEAKVAAKPAKEKKPAANASLDDVLSTVTGGVDKPIAKKDESAGPTKKTLSRGDVAKAMKKITPAAKSCYKVEEFSGMVKIKYSVGSDGTVTKATAGGAHANSKTGACVVKAVKKAKFPPFSGATMSFSFPFLLSP